MKRSEAARYARWSAAVAIAIAILAAGVYLRRRAAESGAQKQAPPPVPENVEQQSAQFSYSRVIGNRTLFTVSASRATEYKDQNRSTLQEVLITIYGRKGDRHDTVGAHECSYVPVSGQIRCQGEVRIDLNNEPVGGAAAGGEMHLDTCDVSFDSANETVSTPAEITLQFTGGRGQATGVIYDAKNEIVRFAKNVQLQLSKSGRRIASPVMLTGSSMEYRRNAELLQLSGPVTAQEGDERIDAGALEVQLDAQMLPKVLLASKGVRLKGRTTRGAASLAAEKMLAMLGAGGKIDRVTADGDVRGNQTGAAGEQAFSAGHVELATWVANGRTEPHTLHAEGNIHAESKQAGVTQKLETTSLNVEFAPAEYRPGFRVVAANTQAPGTIDFSQPGETDHVQAGLFTAEFGEANRLAKLDGASGVQVSRQTSAKPPQIMKAQNFTANFDGAKGWTTLAGSGSVNFRQGAQVAAADRAVISRSADQVVLDGNASVGDSASSTSADHIQLNRSTGEMHATGSVVSSLLDSVSHRPDPLGIGTVHIAAGRMDVSSATGSETFSGNARLWQGDTALSADLIELWRDQKKLQAQGNLHAIIPETPHGSQEKKSPVLWQVQASKMEYWSNNGQISLTGGVQAHSAIGSISGNALEFLLATGPGNQQRVQRATASGNVKIQANGRTGTGERGEYTSNDGKFVLSGGNPTLSDASGNTTTGRELTFFLANDTILVDSQKSSRTVTRHRVEK